MRSLLGWERVLDRETGELRRTGRAVVIDRRCETWACFCCATQLRRRARRRVFKGAALPGRVFMLTLTIDPADRRWRVYRDAFLREHVKRDPRDIRWSPVSESTERGQVWRRAITKASIRYCAESWNRMATAMRRDPELAELLAAGADGRAVVPFTRAVELQRNGRAHLHVLVRVPSLAHGFRYRRRLRELAVRAGFGGDVERGRGMGFDMQAARSRADLSRYVTKGPSLAGYATKASDLMPRHTRRFSYSRSWCEWTPATPVAGWWDWRLAGGQAATVTRALEASGFGMVDPGHLRVRVAAGAGGPPAAGGRTCS